MILALDYGTKRVGVALSDASETLAFPYSVVSNSENLVSDIATLVSQEKVGILVLGHSTTQTGKDNPIMEEIRVFKGRLEESVGVPVIFEREWFSSQEASRFTGTNDMIDASAAAIILQRFLDRKRGV